MIYKYSLIANNLHFALLTYYEFKMELFVSVNNN
jgi:hypothetical protein